MNFGTDIESLRARYEEVIAEKEKLKEENKILKAKYAPKDLVKKVDDLSSQKENLTKENLQLLKVVKKLHRKAEDRKKNLKQLFELMNEKEKEIEQYKNNIPKGNILDNPRQEILKADAQINKNEKEKKIKILDREIEKKEKELKKLEEVLENKNKLGIPIEVNENNFGELIE